MFKVTLILEDIRSTHNVGSILRTADGFGVSHVFFCGYTPYPTIINDPRLPHEREKITRAIHKTALGAETTMSISVHETVQQAIQEARANGYSIASLEQSASSTDIRDYVQNSDMAIILGNEVTGVANDTLDASDITLEIPMFGNKESFNVSVSAAICLYELAREKPNAN